MKDERGEGGLAILIILALVLGCWFGYRAWHNHQLEQKRQACVAHVYLTDLTADQVAVDTARCHARYSN